MMDITEKYEMIQAMKTYGGSFVKALAECFLHADPINSAQLCEAFPGYVKKYSEMAQRGKTKEVKDDTAGD